MKVEDAIHSLRHAFPSLCPREQDVLEHLFVVAGTGCVWLWGEIWGHGAPSLAELPDWLKGQRQREEERLRHMAEYLDSAGLQSLRASLNRTTEQKWADALRRLEDPWGAESSEGVDGKPKRRLYPVYADALILHIPDDVQPDWLDAADRFLSLVDAGTWAVTANDRDQLAKAKTRIASLRKLRSAP